MILWLIAAGFCSPCLGKGRVITRLFWQDDATATVQCADLKKSSDGWTLAPVEIEGLPELDTIDQSLVQMRQHDGLLIVGVRDADDGNIGSGWFAIESGVVEEPHGDHSHWRFQQSPRVISSRIDSTQGNPAHVYRFDDHFVLANDQRDGFTVTTAGQIRRAANPSDATSFHSGGNGHITLAVVPNRVAYATWIAPAGDDAGRVDVVGLGENQGRSYSFQCPSGMLHGAAVNSGKAFFAPADGVCWVSVDPEVDDADNVSVHHLSLGTDADDQPLRTGAFETIGRHVLFAAGKGPDTKFCVIDADAAKPTVDSLAFPLSDGEAMTTPVATKTRYGQTLAFAFVEQKDAPENDRLKIIDLDVNRDGSFEDLALVETVEVGPSQIVGHAGHHSLTVLPDRRHAVITNPGDSSLWVMSLTDFDVLAKLDSGGAPTRVVAVGGP
ncbi:hypothetical protein [Crateriforma spongiae]|uniref:hypothetical protein n=1 Tax=Crateriforma spongiae TaxID=2724528 RepID=UPI001F2FF335|nr:hypothetical protein [Crateriforma spongiae]